MLALVLGMGLSARAADPAASATKPSAVKPYPLSVCVVTGDKLTSMGEPVVIEYKGQEIKFCCSDCKKDFDKDPEKYLKKMQEMANAPATQPAMDHMH